MARAVWQGFIVLDGLGIPVRLYSASHSVRPRFVLLHEADESTVERRLVCEAEQKPIEYSQTIRAVPHGDTYVTISDHELERLGAVSFKTITIKQFCPDGQVPAIYYEKPFYVMPAPGSERVYALMRDVFARERVMAIAQFVMHSRDYLAGLQVYGDVLLLLRLRYSSEITPVSNLRTPALPTPSPDELQAFSDVVHRYSREPHLSDYHDEYAERLNELIEHKAQGLRPVRRAKALPQATPNDMLVEQLHAMLSGAS